MTLSICTVTRASPEHLEPWLLRALEVADELVVTVDAEADPRTVALARELADQVAVAELPGLANPAYAWTAARARGDWVLMLDDDELLAPGFGERLPGLLGDRRFTHYHLPVRWVVPGTGGRPRWIRQFPWHPNRATRLFRNAGGLFRHAPAAHSAWEVHGEGAAPDGEDVAIYHLDLLRDRADRERKVAEGYRRRPDAPTCEEYYLYEDYLDDLELADVPLGLLSDPPTGRASRRAAQRRARTDPPPVAAVSGAELEAFTAEQSDDPPIWAAQYPAHATPRRLGAARGYTVAVVVRNTSLARWRSLGQVHGRVLLSYRWFDLDGRVVIPQGDISLLPHGLAPGEHVTLQAGLWTPAEPGRYRLEWDMLCERVSWFSARGVAPLAVEVEIVDRGPRPSAPHFLAPPAPVAAP